MRLHVQHLNEAIENDSLVIFVGAGISMNSGLPSWNDLINEFKKEMNINKKESQHDNLKIAQYYFDIVGQQKYLQKVINTFKNHDNAEPNNIHKQIFRIRPRHIITTNYDELLEKAMKSEIDKYEVIKQDSDIPYSKSDHYLIKMHGDLIEKNIVLKEDDYLDYEKNFYMVATLIKSLIMNNTILFIGYSLGDSTFNSIFRMIQKGFYGNARKAYFFTPTPQNEAATEYYKNKGINIIAYEKDANLNIGFATSQFLEHLNSEMNVFPSSPKKLWNNIKFLNQSYFVEPDLVARYANLSSHASFFRDELQWNNKKESKFSISKTNKITNFLDNKTNFIQFLDYKSSNSKKFVQNPVLKNAYAVYNQYNYDLSQKMFREIANKSFTKKDYWNYLICEFNVHHIGTDGTDSLPEPVSGIRDLNKAINSLITGGDKSTKKIAMYFRDNIQNFSFIYRKLSKIDGLLDKLRNERKIYKNNHGHSFNNDLITAKTEFSNLISFIEFNCLTVFQYTEFQETVVRYFECLLIAYDNYTYHNNSNTIFNSTSSIIKELTFTDIKNIIPYLQTENVDTLLSNYALSKIRISDKAFNYIIDQINKLSIEIKNNYSFEVSGQLSKFIQFLSFIQIKKIYKLIPLIENYPLYQNNSRDIQHILLILANGAKSIRKADYKKLLIIINTHIDYIARNNLVNSHLQSFSLYSYLINEGLKFKKDFKLNQKYLIEKICLIATFKNTLKHVLIWKPMIIELYFSFDDNLKNYIDQILHKYEKLPDSEFNVSFAVDVIKSGVYDFDDKKKYILKKEITVIQQKSIGVFPDPRESAIANIYNLIQQKYFKLSDVKNSLDLDLIKGCFPEIDWTIFNIYSDKNIGLLVAKYNFKDAKKIFAKNKSQKSRFNQWLLNQANSDNIQLKVN